MVHIRKPAGIKFSKNNKVKEVSIKGNHTGILTEEGELFMLGSTLVNKLGLDHKDVIKIGTPTIFPLS